MKGTFPLSSRTPTSRAGEPTAASRERSLRRLLRSLRARAPTTNAGEIQMLGPVHDTARQILCCRGESTFTARTRTHSARARTVLARAETYLKQRRPL